MIEIDLPGLGSFYRHFITLLTFDEFKRIAVSECFGMLMRDLLDYVDRTISGWPSCVGSLFD